MQNTMFNSRTRIRVIEMLAAIALTLTATDSAFAHDYRIGDLKIDHPWTRATPNGAKAAGGFMKITNNGATPDRLIGGTLVAAGAVEIHETQIDGDVMRMRRLDKGLAIAPGQTVELRPGSYHAMFMQLTETFKEGERVQGTLVFETAGTVAVEFKVEAMGSRTAGQHH